MSVRLLAALVLSAALLAPAVTTGETFAVVPLIGHELTIVGAAPVTSTNLDRNTYTRLAVGDDAFDQAIRAGIDDAVRARHAGDGTLMVQVALPATPTGAEQPDVSVDRIVEAVAPRALDASSKWIVLVVPYRAQPHLVTTEGHIGTGRAAGIGMYVNRYERTHIQGGQGGDGFLGLFANFRVMVFDASTRALRAQSESTVGAMYSAARAADNDPLNALTTKQKIAGLQSLLHDELARVVPGLLDQALR